MDPAASLLLAQDTIPGGSFNITELVTEMIISTLAPNVTNSTR